MGETQTLPSNRQPLAHATEASPTPGSQPPYEQWLRDLLTRWREIGSKTALQMTEQGRVNAFSYDDLLDLSRSLAVSWTLNPQFPARIAILSESRPEWIVALIAAFRAGVTLVALDPQLKDGELAQLISQSQVDAVLVSRLHAHRLRGSAAAVWDLEGVVAQERAAPQSSHHLLPSNLDKPLITIYGSGTTGRSRAIMISARNLLFEAAANAERVGVVSSDRVLSILPINHLYELSAGTLTPLYMGGTVIYANTLMPHEIAAFIRDQSITMMAAVPLFLKAMKRSIELSFNKLPKFKRRQLDLLMWAAPFMSIEWRRRLIPVRRNIGEHLRLFISGGAPLPVNLQDFYSRIGIPVLQGYGLSEASPVVACTSVDDNRKGSCGKPLRGTEIKIVGPDEAGIGVIHVRGPQVMLGFWNNIPDTEAVLGKDGWLDTGDLGYLDRDGFLFVTGRSRNLVVLGAGKKVYPEEVEAMLTELASSPSYPLLKELCVTSVKSGDWDEVALVGVPSDELNQESGGNSDLMKATLTLQIEHLLATVADYKHPRRILLSSTPLPKTSTHKIKLVELAELIRAGSIH